MRFLIFFALFLSGFALADSDWKPKYINLEQTLFGIEYTFQDQAMVDEPGRMTLETPHKRERFNIFRDAYVRELGVDSSALGTTGSIGFKPGNTISVPGDGKHVINMEPVTIEVNTTPKTYGEIVPSAEKIYRASREANLVPYVQPAAERSGMGHIHVGGKSLGASPMYKNPNLLRNLMVYLHKHPAVLWGFAEAYDIGLNSNIETFHEPARQEAFARAIKKFDDWYKHSLNTGGDLRDGLRQFLKFLSVEDKSHGFFKHYRYINLEHLRALADQAAPLDPRLAGKYTVEFRNFRPPSSPLHAKANADLLLGLMDHLSKPGYLEPFERIDPAAYDRFHSATKVAADWERVKADLPNYNLLWDDMVKEYVQVQQSVEAVRASLPEGTLADIYPAFSRKDDKGTKFELRIPGENREQPKFSLEGKELSWERVKVGKEHYWIATFDAKGPELTAKEVRAWSSPERCMRWFRAL